MASSSAADDPLDALLAELAAAPPVRADLAAGSRIGEIELLELLGEGGMGRVFRARDHEHGRDVAIKVVSAARIGREGIPRLLREAKLLARVEHPSVVRILGVGAHHGDPYLILELLSGQTLRNVMRAERLAESVVARYAGELLDALCAVHGHGVVHRDLKPENVIITEHGALKLLDFGLAKQALDSSLHGASIATGTGVILGSAGYMSPEQARGQPSDVRSDIFAFGALLYELCAGTPAFSGPSAVETMHAILSSRPHALGTLGRFDALVRRCLEKDPAQRFQSAAEARGALDRSLQAPLTDDTSPRCAPDFTPPVTRYARNGDVHIAYQIAGEQGPDVLFVPGFVSQLEHWWQEPEGIHMFGSMASVARLIMLDKRGTGLSDRVPADRLPSLEERLDDLTAVLDAAGSRRAILMGVSEGGPQCMSFAARFPERVSGLVLYGTSAIFGATPSLDYLLDCARNRWGTGACIDLFGPSVREDARMRDWMARWERLGASPGAVYAILEMLRRADVRSELPAIRVPTLVLHREGDRAVPVQCAHYLAKGIPGATLRVLRGDDHVPMVGDVDMLLREIASFVRRVGRGDDASESS